MEKSYDAIIAGKGDIISCKYQTFFNSNEIGLNKPTNHFNKPTKFNMLLKNHITNSALCRKSDFEKCGGYDKAFDKGWEDYDLWLNMILSLNLKIYRIDEVLFFYRIKNSNESRNHLADNYNSIPLTIALIKKYPILLIGKSINLFIQLWRFIFQKKITRNGNLIVKICKIPVFYKQLSESIVLIECKTLADKIIKENKSSFDFKKHLTRELFKKHNKTNILQYWYYRLSGKI